MKQAKRILLLLILTVVELCLVCCYSGDGAAGDPAAGDDIGLIIPESTNLGRDVINFSEIEYQRPDVTALKDKFHSLYGLISDKEASFEQISEQFRDAYADYERFNTLKTYAQIVSYSQIESTRYQYELRYLSEAEPAIKQLLEQVLVAMATSEFAERFENELVGAGLIENYSGGSKLTTEVLELITAEELLILEYEGLNHGTVEITYDSITDTYNAILAHLREKYGQDSQKYVDSVKECDALYSSRLAELSADVFVNLVKIRSKLAHALGYQSYTDYIYANRYTDYTPEEAGHLFEDISRYVVPVYAKLASRVFNSNNRQPSPASDKNLMLNTLGNILKSSDNALYEAYAFMLAYGMFDVSEARSDRSPSSFTAYLPSYETPYLFVTLDGTVSDYLLFCHEFGHFYDMLENYGNSAALDLSEVSSQSLELLMLTKLKGSLGDKEYGKLFYRQMESVMLTLIYQAFYAKLEHIVYSLPYHEITLERINKAAKEAAAAMSLNADAINGVSDVIIPHLIVEPLYVQSYCTSAIVALEMFFSELEEPGDGFAMYHNLISRSSELGFLSCIELLGLDSPFDRGTVKQVADSIYYIIIGSHYFESAGDNNTASVYPSPPFYYKKSSALCA